MKLSEMEYKIEYLRIYIDDLNTEMTIKDFLKFLLKTLWIDEEHFSGKCPFGNSGWKGPIEAALIKNKIVSGKLDEDGYIEEVNDKKVNKIILKIIENL